MGLVDYSDSENSDSDPAPASVSKPTIAPSTSKPAFKKVVDRSNPRKILVNLPKAAEQDGESAEDGPPAKRARVSGRGGAFSGFNALLPAPKRTGQAMGGGLGKGVSLKTGATPGFSREEAAGSLKDVEGGESNSTPPPPPPSGATPETAQANISLPAPKPTVPSTIFKPLSVSRKPQSKKKPPSTISSAPQPSSTLPPPPKPKSSLFSFSASEPPRPSPSSNGDYTPLLYNPTDGPPDSTYTPEQPPDTRKPSPPPPQPQTLDLIADTLNLTASQKRQLLGRHPPATSSPITLLTFDTDTEYANNNALRTAGETVQHNPVRAIAPGKHSLKQLVNAASTQREALEEHFATGKRNKKEAGSRYGW